MKLIDADKCEKGLRANITECVIKGDFYEAEKWQNILEYIKSIPAACDFNVEEN